MSQAASRIHDSRFAHKPQAGFLLVALLFTTSFIMVVGLVTIQLALSNLQRATTELYRVDSQFAADAGLDHAIQSLNQDGTWTGSAGELTLTEDSKTKTTFETTVINDTDPYKKFVNVTARTYAPKTDPAPRITRKYQVELRGVGGGSFSVVTGVGGLVMSNSSKIVGGDVYVNGTISMTNSSQIGLTTNPVNVKAAHQSCPTPADATYPRVCNAGENGQPITLTNTAKIYGEVTATNQTNGASMSNPGLVGGSVAPAALPSHDRSAIVNAVASTQSGSAASCSSGSKTWPANLKIDGDVTISNTCKVTVEGNIWITGSLMLTNSSELIVKNGITAPPEIMIDGSSGAQFSNSSILRSNNTTPNPVGFRVITYWSNAACSPECADVTGTDLFNSRNTTTINLTNGSSGPQTEFYSRWSRVNISNSGNIGALVGQTVRLQNSGTITFGTSVSGVGGISAWVVESYKRTF